MSNSVKWNMKGMSLVEKKPTYVIEKDIKTMRKVSKFKREYKGNVRKGYDQWEYVY